MANSTGNSVEHLAGSFAGLKTIPNNGNLEESSATGLIATTGTTPVNAGDTAIQGTHESEDVDMDAPESGSVATHLVLDESLQGIMNTALIPIPKSAVNTGMSALEMMKGRRKDLLKKADMLAVAEGSEAPELETEHNMALIDTLNRRIAILEQADKEDPPVKGSAASKWANPVDSVRIKKADLPKFQLASTATHFVGFPKYENVKIYLSEFEKVIKAETDQIDLVWTRYIPLTLSYEYDGWVENELLKRQSWADARALFEKKFGNVRGREEAIRRVYNSFMGADESIEAYTTKFLRDIFEAGRKKTDPGMAEKYRTSLHVSIQTNLLKVMEAREKALDTFTIDEIAEIARSVYRHEQVGYSGMQLKSTGESFKGKRKAPLVDGGFFCSKHGGSKATHNERDCHSVKKVKHGPNNVFLGQKNAPFRATGNQESRPSRPCKYCGKPWTFGHKCQEFYDAKRNKAEGSNHRVLAVRANLEEVQAKRIEDAMEKDSLNCKYKELEQRNNPFKLITPIILNNRKLIAKIDTGSDITCINKYILDTTFDNKVLINKVSGSSNFLSLDKNKTDNKVQRIGKTEPMTIRYLNNMAFEHAFEVVEFSSVMETEFDILLGTDILSRLRIGLTGVAHCYPKDINKEDAQFENVNFDTKSNCNPEDTTYGSPEVQKKFMDHIQNSIDQNKLIKAGSFCTMKESIVHIPIKENATNCYVRQYPLPYHARPEIEKQLQEWLDTGVVVECEPSAKHNTPLLAIPKRDANNNFTKHRIVMDLRRCNLNIDEKNIQDFAVPNIKDIFDEVTAKGQVFTKLDLKNAYHSFKVADASQEVLSFTVNNKTYKWVGCCFGLKFVTSLYFRVINLLFQGMEGVQTYVDDCCIYSNPEDHAALVKMAIDRLTSVNLKINFDKCTWFKTSIYILGFTVGAGVRKIDTRRLSNLDAWKTPKNSADVRKLMGFITYLHEFIPMISKVAAPINALRHCKDKEFQWTSLHSVRFQTLKDIILSDAVLHTPRMDRKFYLEPDSSLYATAAALTQRDEHGRTLHIAFFRPLLWGHPDIEVRTDHRSLVYMQTSTTLCRTLQNYMEVLNDFNFTVVHLKGINNILPDTLSRVYPPIPEDKTLLGDEEKKIIKLEKCILQRRLPNDKINNVVRKANDQFIRKERIYSTDKNINVLAVRLNSKTFKESHTDYIAPPTEERDKLLREAHLLGHFGSESIV
ncbi:hypothetical protein INT47_003618 [Mucor saturninus]|uniref:Reverse transcriptase domain-containing protein n=1 Tax=Mucor saturninus TaxID=64648 RepID=A0A8H7QFN4_9FUNG|nr:hypothetical protein INT47_003618 [Mucor saturninus]